MARSLATGFADSVPHQFSENGANPNGSPGNSRSTREKARFETAIAQEDLPRLPVGWKLGNFTPVRKIPHLSGPFMQNLA
jgi:hypothetical protein